MPNLGSVIKEEIRRLARKEVRAAMRPLQKRLAETRQIAADLRRRVAELEEASRRLTRESNARMLQAARASEEEADEARLGPRSIRSQRKRFRLTREEFALLVGVSPNTVYLWESGKAAPRGRSRAALVGIRKVGVREAKRLLEAARSAADAGRAQGGEKK